MSASDIPDLLAEIERLTVALHLAHTLRGDLERIIATPCPECAMHEHGKAGAERDALAATIERVLALHRPNPHCLHDGVPCCDECEHVYPCPTVRALDGGES